MKSNIFKQALIFVFILNLLAGTMTFGQTNRTGKGSSGQWGTPTTGCRGGWSGIVTYTKTLRDSLTSDEPGIRKNIDRIKHKTSREYDYVGRTIVDGTDPKNPLVTSKVSFTDKDKTWGEERVFDTCNSRENGHWFIIEGTDDRLTQAQAEGPARSFNLNVDELTGMYSFNVQLPHAAGTFNREEHVKRSGHCQAKNNLPYDRSTNEAAKVDGESFSIYGERLDPDNPDRISGSKTWGDDGKGAVRSFVYTVTWRFTRCPQKLLITDLRFEQMKFPNWDDWQEIVEQKGTIDGNWIRIKAKVLNLSAEAKFAEVSFKETYKGDRWNYMMPDLPLKDSSVSVRLEPGEEREVEVLWDSTGYAWFDDGRARLVQRIKVEAWEEYKLKDSMTKNLKIAPKPLIVVHGIWSSPESFKPHYQNYMTTKHSYDWKAFLAGDKDGHGKLDVGGKFMSGGATKSVYDNADELDKYIKYAQTESNAWHIDMVGHSTGGLIARLWLHKFAKEDLPDRVPHVLHLLMLGTPNNGVPCADAMKNVSSQFKDKLRAADELMPDEMRRFNSFVRNTKGTKLASLVGIGSMVGCTDIHTGDGFVPYESARYGVADYAYADDVHPDLVSHQNFTYFVLPRIIKGPKGTYPMPIKSGESTRTKGIFGLNQQDPAISLFANASYEPASANPEAANPQSFSKELMLAPKQSIDIDLPVAAAANLGLTFMANPGISVSLVNDKGVVVAKNLAGSNDARAFYRTLYIKSAVSQGTWKLHIENTADLEQPFLGFTWSAGSAKPASSVGD